MNLRKFAFSIYLPLILGVVFFFAVYPHSVLNPFNVEWILHGPSREYQFLDLHPYYLGWQFFRRAPWTFPIGSIPNFVYPLNTYLAYTDSIPLLAVALRPFTEYMPENFQYLGPWIFLCCILQNFFTWRLLKRWIQDPWYLAIATILAAWAPVFVFRSNHIALLGQWLLLWALDIVARHYLNENSSENHPRLNSFSLFESSVLAIIATGVQPYIAVMALGICWTIPLAEFFAARRQRRLTLHQNIFAISYKTSILILAMILTLYALGFLSSSSYSDGFGWFATDALGFFNNHRTSWFVPSFRRKFGLYEGYSWPGLGMWFLIACVGYQKYRNRIPKIQPSATILALKVTLGLMFFFALGSRVCFGSFWIIDLQWFWSHFQFLISSLRSCGRFVWPLYYVLLLGSLVATYRAQRLEHARTLVTVALLIQMIDMGPWYFKTSNRFPPNARMSFSKEAWDLEFKDKRHIKLIPPSIESSECNTGGFWYEWAEFSNYAAIHNLTINSGYLARYPQNKALELCQSDYENFKSMPLARDTVYIVRLGFEDKVPTQGPDRQCKLLDGFTVCQATTTQN